MTLVQERESLFATDALSFVIHKLSTVSVFVHQSSAFSMDTASIPPMKSTCTLPLIRDSADPLQKWRMALYRRWVQPLLVFYLTVPIATVY